MFEQVYSCVKTQGYTSDWFPILQGTRQGQVMSPRLYLIFINDLMNNLELSKNSFKMQVINLACPTSADDMVFVSLTKHGLDDLINKCYQNSIQDRYNYNATKSNVVFNEVKQPSRRNSRKWFIGPNPIEESDSYTHLGVLCSKDINLNENISDACSKLPKTFFSLADCGVHKTGLHPITSRHLFKTSVLSKALFGCELWCSINDSQIHKIESSFIVSAYNFCNLCLSRQELTLL